MESRRGFTLVELLVVVAIIGILMALLFPAVQAAREAGRRIACANHLRQFALAVTNYSTAHDGRLPPTAMVFFLNGGRKPLSRKWPCSAWSQPQSLSWRVAVLPFLEEQNLYDQVDFAKGALTKTNLPVASQVLAVFQCPSTPGYPRSTRPADASRALSEASVGAADYGIPRNNIQVRRYAADEEFALPPAWNGVKNPLSKSWLDYDGCPFEVEFGSARLKWVTDGLSKTTVAHEVAYRPNSYSRKGRARIVDGERVTKQLWLNDQGWGWSQIEVYNPGVAYPVNESNARAGRFAFHPGGVNNAFLDGSVRFLEESTDLRVLASLVTRAGGLDF